MTSGLIVYGQMAGVGYIDPAVLGLDHTAALSVALPVERQFHLPHARERDKSAEVVVTHQPKVCDPSAEGLWDLSAELAHRFGSGPGIRTLNLAVNRSLRPVQKPRSEFAECR